MRSIFRIPSDNMAGDTWRRVPIHYYSRRYIMKNKLILYIAMSLDGYIAEKDGNISFLDETPSPSPDLGYEAFYHSLQELILGGITYRQIKNELSPD